MRRCCRPNLRLAPYSLCLCFSRPRATALISIQEEIFQLSLRVDLDDPHFRSERSNEGLENIFALKRDCFSNYSALASNQCVYQ